MELWTAKDPGIELDDALVRVRTHLERIEARMPLDRLPVERRAVAAELRAWYRDVFMDARDAALGRGEERRAGEEPER